MQPFCEYGISNEFDTDERETKMEISTKIWEEVER